MKKLFKKIYRLLPFKKQLYSALRRVISPPESVYKHLHFHGNFQVKVDEEHSFEINHFGQVIENELFWEGLYGGWEKESMEVWVRLCRRSNIIFDIGANTGVYSLAAKAVNPSAVVFAFEPVRRVFNRLQGNMRLNDFDTVCVEKAASNYDGKAKIYDSYEDHILSVTVNKNLSGSDGELNEEIETVQLQTYIRQKNIESIDLMKIDVETHEPQVLEGMGGYLEKFKPVLLIEILTDEVAGAVNNKFKGTDYLFFYIDDEKKTVQRVDLITKQNSWNYLLCPRKVAEELGL